MRASAGRGSAGEWYGLAVFFGCNVLFAAGLFSHAFLYNFYLDGLGLGEGVMGGAVAALTAGGLTALAPAGQVVDRWGAGRCYLAAAVLTAVGLALGAVARTALPVYGAAFLAGAGTATWRVSMGPLLMRLTSATTRTRAFSWNVAALLASGAVWTAVSGAVPGWLGDLTGMGREGGIRVGLLLGAAGTLLAAVFFTVLRANADVDADRTADVPDEAVAGAAAHAKRVRGPGFRERLGIPADLGVLVGVVALWMLAAGLVLPFLNLYFLRIHGLEVDRIGLLFGVAQAVTAILVFGSGDVAARLGARRLLLMWAWSFAPLLWILGGATSLTLAMAVYLLQGFVPPATNPLIDQLLLERAPRGRHGAVSTWRNAATEFSGLAGAAIGGAVLEAASFGVLFGAAGAVAAAGAIGLVVAMRRSPGVHAPAVGRRVEV